MWDKVLWLFIWTTLAFWVGCSAGPADREADVSGAVQRALAEADSAEGDAAPAPQAESLAVEEALAEPASDDETVQTPFADSAEPAATLDRSHWTPMVVFPRRGRVAHWPVYYSREIGNRSWRQTQDRPSPLLMGGDWERQAQAVTESQTRLYGGGQFGDALLGSLNFAVDTVLLPYRMIRTPPWQVQLSGRGSVLEAQQPGN